ncbi:DUF134 domain-containing protein [Thiocystis violacea]|uniref:DUF134 domain-containing protein n=1 Tax=Thiocystis violacea TaxID=13725 RepID=UPI0019075E6F|nr:hypothetical protein [Thiocystis violacea]
MTGRKRRARCIGFDPGFLCFKPCGRPGRGMATVVLRADELEALRLADLEGLYQEDCAQRMGISRTTLSRTLAEARRKVTDALLNGKRLLVEPVREIEEVATGRKAPDVSLREPGADTISQAGVRPNEPEAPPDERGDNG